MSVSAPCFQALAHSVHSAWNTLSCPPTSDAFFFTVLQLNGVYSERSSLTSASQLRYSFLAITHHAHPMIISLVTWDVVLCLHICLSATAVPLKHHTLIHTCYCYASDISDSMVSIIDAVWLYVPSKLHVET